MKSKTNIGATRSILSHIRNTTFGVYDNYEKEIRRYIRKNDCSESILCKKYDARDYSGKLSETYKEEICKMAGISDIFA